LRAKDQLEEVEQEGNCNGRSAVLALLDMSCDFVESSNETAKATEACDFSQASSDWEKNVEHIITCNNVTLRKVILCRRLPIAITLSLNQISLLMGNCP
jgi:hypothetical protein